MDEVRILAAEEFAAAARIFGDAYPGLKIVSDEDRSRFRDRILRAHEQDPAFNFYGLFRAGQLLGIMALYDFEMNFLGSWLPVGGVGQVAVDLGHKKEHVARDMMLAFLRHYRAQGAPLAALYPFRPDFYRSMGFGYGTKMSQYRLQPAAFPRGPSKAHVRPLTEADKQALAGCYERFAQRTHGMIAKNEAQLRRLFSRPEHRFAGCELDGLLRGYLVFKFEPGETFTTNDIHLVEMVYETPQALSELLTFLHDQADQIRHVYVATQDEDFHHLLRDPRNDSGRLIPDVYHETNAQGVGLMLRVIDMPGLFARLGGWDFGGQTLALKLTVADRFVPENAGSSLLRFEGGRVQRMEAGTCDVEVRLAIEDLSSLLAGTVHFRSLHSYGLATISDPGYVEMVSRAFAVEQKPVCMTSF